MKKNELNEVGYVRPDALKEELTSVKIIGTEKKPKVEVVKMVNLKTKPDEVSVCPSYFTQYYG